jgi:hypothetical protein
MGELGCIAQASLACVSLSLFLTPVKWRLPKPFIAKGRAVTMSPEAQQMTLGQVKPYAIGTTGRSSK